LYVSVGVIRLDSLEWVAQRLAERCGEAAGSSTEWSLACPGSGIALDCCSLLTSVLALEVVVAGSLVGAAGSTPNTVVLGAMAGSVVRGPPALTGGVLGKGVFSVHPALERANRTATKAVTEPLALLEPSSAAKFVFVMVHLMSLMDVIMA
jgi:hypothetical protein